MTSVEIKKELLAGGLHEGSVERTIEHYEEMRHHLSQGNYPEVGVRVGKFCENVANILRVEFGEDVDPNGVVDEVINRATSGNVGSDHPVELRLTIPRLLRAAYELRSRRNHVHVNLEVPVNHNDSQTAVRICTWILSELLRLYGEEEHMDKIAEIIDDLASPVVPYVDYYNGKRLLMHQELETREEILIHLFLDGGEIDAENLVEWIPGSDNRQIKGSLGALKSQRLVHYEDGIAAISSLGAKEAENLIKEHFEEGELPSPS